MSPLRPTTIVSRARNLERIRQISEVAVRHGFGYFFERHNLWQVLHLRHAQPAPPPANLGVHVRKMLEELGPTFVKFGQLLSTRPDIVPAEIIGELVRLQDAVPPFPGSVARRVIEEELGLGVERLFASFTPEPIAAASIGQVHRAMLPGGAPVVVKVQRPEAARQIQRDIELLYQLAELTKDHLGSLVAVDPVRVVHEFARSITHELDYVLEARNAERFAENFAGDERVLIPRVYRRYCTRRVLTLEWIEGPTLNTIDLETLDPTERLALAGTLTHAWFTQILEHGFFHGDPHPANILVVRPDRIALLDFGTAGVLARSDLEEGTYLFLDVMNRDIEGVRRRLKRLGVRWPKEKDREVAETLEDAFNRYFGARLSEVDPGAILHEMFNIIYGLRLELPTRFLLLDKSLFTIEGVVSQVYPDFNVFESAKPYARRLLLQRYTPAAVVDALRRTLSTYGEIFREYPFQIHDMLEEIRDGELEIKFVHTGLDNLIRKLDILTNRVVVALVAAALGLASSIVAVFVTAGPQVLGLSIWGIPGFLAALFFGVWLMYAIVRSGRL